MGRWLADARHRAGHKFVLPDCGLQSLDRIRTNPHRHPGECSLDLVCHKFGLVAPSIDEYLLPRTLSAVLESNTPVNGVRNQHHRKTLNEHQRLITQYWRKGELEVFRQHLHRNLIILKGTWSQDLLLEISSGENRGGLRRFHLLFLELTYPRNDGFCPE